MNQESQINTPFLRKLNHILQESKFSEMITWDKTGTMIDILDEQAIQTQILPKFFRHNKFESFIRQLNLYGFKKIKKTNLHRFRHAQLVKGKSIFSIKSQRKQKILDEQQKQAIAKVKEEPRPDAQVAEIVHTELLQDAIPPKNGIQHSYTCDLSMTEKNYFSNVLNLQLLYSQSMLAQNLTMEQIYFGQPNSPIAQFNPFLNSGASSLQRFQGPSVNMNNMFFYN